MSRVVYRCRHCRELVPEDQECAHCSPFVESDKNAKEQIAKLERALCIAVCIIQNEAGIAVLKGGTGWSRQLHQWAKELIDESGMNWNEVLQRTTLKT